MSEYVSTTAELEELVELLAESKVLCIDTEFLREKTYYAKLCLVQVNNGEISAVVDPLRLDLRPFGRLLADSSIVKVFHAGGQDIGILLHETGVVPRPVFDTQTAAALLGYPLQVGYGPLVRSMCQVKLDKADSFTDWSRRPLTKHQLKYALDDVRYLPEIYDIMVADLEKSGRLAWLDAEFADMSNPARYEAEPREMWHKVKRISSLSRHQLAIVRELASWREQQARLRDIPRKWVLPDEALVEVARKEPNTRERLLEVRGLASKLTERDIAQILEAVRLGGQVPQSQMPRLERHVRGDRAVDGAVDLMTALVDVRAAENNVAAPVLASHDDLVRLARGHRKDNPVLKGWRAEMVGNDLVELLEGRLTMYLQGGAIKVARRP